jgi:MurNAc alpha-1-phosphate uridylyltransferase
MILAAGRGERMRPLTDQCPKPLLPAGGKPLIVWHIEALVAAGIREIVINHAWLGAQLEAAIGDGSTWGAQVQWSAEAEALETAGGIVQALPRLVHGRDPQAPFAVVNGDIWTDYDRRRLPQIASQLEVLALDAWCVLVPNPAHHREGDFLLAGDRLVPEDGHGHAQRLTFSGIGVYQPTLFDGVAPGSRAPLAPRLRAAIDANRAGGERHDGTWVDVGTPERLSELDAMLVGRYSSKPSNPYEFSEPQGA